MKLIHTEKPWSLELLKSFWKIPNWHNRALFHDRVK